MSNSGDGDKRKVSTDALETLGTIIGPNERRDAIHIAVEPVIAKRHLRPGDHVRADGDLAVVESEGVGIVDPFLLNTVKPGERFWLLIYPRQIHSLRHVWTHPAFPDAPEVAGEMPKMGIKFISESEAWIRNYAAELDLGYERLMSGADEWIESRKDGQWGEYLVDGGNLEGTSTKPEFWDHYAKVRGVEVPTKDRENFFSCSC
jgi:hypothetical protein